MRAGPLSNPKVISLLNGYFVCAYTSNNDPSAGEEEKQEQRRVRVAFLKAKMGQGTVSPYLFTADRRPLGRCHVAEATRGDRLLKLLEKVIAEQKLKRGAPVVKPAPQAVPPRAAPGSLVLHLTARKLGPRGSWNQFPSEDWVVLTKAQQGKLFPAGQLKAGTAWTVDKDVAAQLLTHFFPQTETTTPREDVLLAADGPHKHRLEKHELKATVLSADKKAARVRLDGSLKLHHKWYRTSKEGPHNYVEGTVVGYLDLDPAARCVRALRLVTHQASYGKTPVGVAVRSLGP
jgi:hypothetical protein